MPFHEDPSDEPLQQNPLADVISAAPAGGTTTLDVPIHPPLDDIIGPRQIVPPRPPIPQPMAAGTDPRSQLVAAITAGLMLGLGPRSGLARGAGVGLEQAWQGLDARRLRQYQFDQQIARQAQITDQQEQRRLDAERAATQRAVQSELATFIKAKTAIETREEYDQLVADEVAKLQAVGLRGFSTQWFHDYYKYVDRFGVADMRQKLNAYYKGEVFKKKLDTGQDWQADRLKIQRAKNEPLSEMSIREIQQALGQYIAPNDPFLSVNESLRVQQGAIAEFRREHGRAPGSVPGEEDADRSWITRRVQGLKAIAAPGLVQTPTGAFLVERTTPAMPGEEPPVTRVRGIPVPTEKDPFTRFQQFQMAERLGNDWQKVTGPVQEMDRQLRIMHAGLEQSRAGDRNGGSQAVLVTFQKILDPLSVVREAEYNRGPQGQAFLRRLAGYIPRLKKGGTTMSPEELGEMVKTAESMYAGMAAWTKKQRTRLDAMATEFGIQPTLIFGSDVVGTPLADLPSDERERHVHDAEEIARQRRGR